MRAVDCQGLGGAFTLGTVRAGFDVVHKAELPGGFGMENCLQNRALLGDFTDEIGPEEEWTARTDIPFLFGNPPCSGFSLMNTAAANARAHGREPPASARGKDSNINDCMKALIAYAGRCFGSDGKLGPEIVAFESVPQAGRRDGRSLMRFLRMDLEQRTGQDYNLTLVFMSGAAVGAAQYRKRFFFVAHRVPFGVEIGKPQVAATYRDAIEDLQGLTNTWDQQYRRRKPSGWATAWDLPREDSFVDAHFSVGEERLPITRLLALMPWWEPGMRTEQAAQAAWDATGRLPEPFEPGLNPYEKKWGFNQTIRIRWDKPGYVITGGGNFQFVHPVEDRMLSIRELARLQGFPDEWDFGGNNKSALWIGKGVPVPSGLWLASWAKRSLEGQRGSIVGTPVPDKEVGLEDREYVIDVTNNFIDPSK